MEFVPEDGVVKIIIRNVASQFLIVKKSISNAISTK
jgi:hypothetical protein